MRTHLDTPATVTGALVAGLRLHARRVSDLPRWVRSRLVGLVDATRAAAARMEALDREVRALRAGAIGNAKRLEIVSALNAAVERLAQDALLATHRGYPERAADLRERRRRVDALLVALGSGRSCGAYRRALVVIREGL